MTRANSQSNFARFAKWTSRHAGRPWTFVIALSAVITWALSGPFFDYSDTWQLAINTGTTIVTFLMVFLIQATQNRDSEAIQLKLDELIRSMHGAHLTLMDLEDKEDAELERLRARYAQLAERARRDLDRGIADTGPGDLDPAR